MNICADHQVTYTCMHMQIIKQREDHVNTLRGLITSLIEEHGQINIDRFRTGCEWCTHVCMYIRIYMHDAYVCAYLIE
jgi:hypothetical protein